MKERGQIYWVKFDPSQGSEIQKTRPAIIISNNHSNRRIGRYIVIPLSSQTSKVYPTEIIINLGGQSSKAMADQITTVDESRVKGYLGETSVENMYLIESLILKHLDLPRTEEE